jgi:hypothetical protein
LDIANNNYKGIVSDTGDHSFSKEQRKEESLSDIAEEDAVSLVSERLLLK